MKAALILNPYAGGGKALKVEDRAVKLLELYGVDCEVFVSDKFGDVFEASRNASRDGFDVVIAGGGDGTVNEVANGLVGSDVPMGVLPIGSVNVLARELGIPLNLNRAARVIAQKNVRDIDLGTANGRYFSLMAGFGFDAEVISGVLQPLKDVIGSSAYVFKALEMLVKCQATNVSLELPSGTYETEAYLIIVANTSTYTYNLKMAPYASCEDGLLDICVFERNEMDRFGFAGQIAELFVQRHVQNRAFKYFRARKVVIRSEPEINVQLDGDTFCSTPVEISVSPKILPVILPIERMQRVWSDQFLVTWFDNLLPMSV